MKSIKVTRTIGEKKISSRILDLMTTHAGQGVLAGALPLSRRKAGKVFSSGITPASQAAKNLTAAYNSVASVPGESLPGGVALNMKYTPMKAGDDKAAYMKEFGDKVQSYFQKGGLSGTVQYSDLRRSYTPEDVSRGKS